MSRAADPGPAALGHRRLSILDIEGGVQPMLRVFFSAGGPTTSDTTFFIRSQVIKKSPLSWIPASSVISEHAYPPPLSTALWKKDFIYVFEAPLHHRIGLEHYWGVWSNGPPLHSPDGKIDLAFVP